MEIIKFDDGIFFNDPLFVRPYESDPLNFNNNILNWLETLEYYSIYVEMKSSSLYEHILDLQSINLELRTSDMILFKLMFL